ncbi:MAG: AAA family ATPase [Planctomycetia bacterium]|nr:AAA family ATPase [Planctomycetia bacterium]
MTTPLDAQGQHAAVRRLLAEPGTYPDRPSKVDLIETHISCVFVTDQLVYKLKKPVHFEFVDFSTALARHTACEEEVRLNRRLAPHVYLDVLPITEGAGGGLALGGSGTPIDWVVRMRRLPIERTLEARVRAGILSPDEVAALARVLGDFYAKAPPLAIDPNEYRGAIEAHVRANLRDLAENPNADQRDRSRAVHAAQLEFLTLRPAVFDARVEAGAIIDGHGDLRPEHCCLTDPPVVFDCLEFDPRLRRLDVADELAFLAVECQRLGAAWVGEQVLEACLARRGDRPPDALVAFYKSYRACVRAKVAVLRAAQLPPDKARHALDEATGYLRLADEHTREFARPIAIVTSGLMGSGKSTLAGALAEKFALDVLSTDAIRRDLFGAPDERADYAAGRYAPEGRRRVYDELLRRAEATLAARRGVILDATFLSAELLRRAVSMARTAEASALVVRCECPDAVARGRIAARIATGKGLSDARPEFFDEQLAELEAIPPDVPHLMVDTTAPLVERIDAVVARLRAATAPLSD